MRQIVCLSTSNFHPYPTRKQNVMLRLPDSRVLYFDPPVSYLAPLKDKAAKPRLRAYKRAGEQAAPHITVYAMPPVLPFGNKFRFINRLNQRRLAKYVRRRMAEQGVEKPLLWCYSPSSADILPYLPHRALVYDCVDRHSAYRGIIDPRTVDGMERELARAADMVFSTAVGLHERLIADNPRAYLIPNGANYELFAQAADDSPVIDKSGKRDPVFGFVGMLQDCIAYDYLTALADAYPEGEIRLIGRLMPGVDISELQKRSNIRLLGLVEQRRLPELMREFDVCLNIFAAGKLSRDVSPLKFYEYLATGKPVVSTREPLQVGDYADMIYLADDREDFVRQCRAALAESGWEKKRLRMEAAKAASWDKRVEEMLIKLVEAGVFREDI